MPDEYASRHELNGLGQRVGKVENTIAAHDEAMDTLKEGGRDLWSAVKEGRGEDKRIEGMINQIAKDVAKQNVLFLIINAAIVSLIVKFLGDH